MTRPTSRPCYTKCFQLTGEEGIHEEEHGNEERDDDEVSNDPAAVLRKRNPALVRGGRWTGSAILLASIILMPVVLS